MALHYNLAKVYAISDNDPDFVHQIVRVFVLDTPIDLDHIKGAIEEKNHQKCFEYAHKIKPSLDLLSLNIALEEVVLIELWAKSMGKKKEVIELYKSVSDRIEKAIKEIKKDFNLKSAKI
ncbi:MAG: histidine kinase [Flavobacterium sp.]|jgi:HPt (histidine-containing phosphotransfer) domain-containing protein|nr:histidine kinase [Flavobacterium sp.]